MKSFILVLCCVASFSAFSQTTYLADTAFYTDRGNAGAEASCKISHMQYNGWNMSRALNEWVADAFTVPAGATWKFDTVIVYGYQYGSSTISTFLNCNLQIFNGTPGLGGTVIWGDTSTNVMVNTDWTGIYKVDTFAADNGLNGTYRPIMYMKLYLSPAPSLSAGTYWLAWSAAGSRANPSVAPDKVLPGRINPTGQMARGLYGGSWSYLTDSGQVNGMDMIIKASAGLASVPVMQNNSAAVLGQNIPNPFNNETTISYYLPQAGYANLTVYNVVGQIVSTPVNGEMGVGNHQIVFHADELPGGTYYYKLSTAAGTETKQMVLIK